MGTVVKYYTQFYDFLEKDDFTMVLVGSSLVTLGPMWILNLFFLSIELTGKPQWMLKYKVQPNNTVPAEPKKIWRTAKILLFNQFVLGYPVVYIIYWCSPLGFCDPGNIPSVWIVLRDLMISRVLEDATFYYSHRLLHYGPLYKAIHKQHHEWQSPIGISSLYAHPVEYVLGNAFPVVLGPLLLRSHMLTMLIWQCFGVMDSVLDHCGYHMPFVLKSPQHHDFHHLKFTGNYGTALGLFDWLHGTDTAYRKSVQYQRSGILTSLTPVHILHPEEKFKEITKSE